MKSTYLAALRDLIIAAEIRRQHESLDRMQQEALAESQRACDYYDVELKRCQEFDRYGRLD
jgi:hypothetical protein